MKILIHLLKFIFSCIFLMHRVENVEIKIKSLFCFRRNDYIYWLQCICFAFKQIKKKGTDLQYGSREGP
jgi:hypothetical protein